MLGITLTVLISYIQATLSSFWRQNGDSFKSRSKHPVLKKKLKRSDAGNAFLQIGESSFKSEYFGKIPGSDVKPGSPLTLG